MYGGSTAPTGYLLCDGSAVSRTTYADLYTAIGTTYGVGDGSTTFNVPNVKGKVPVGRDNGDTSFDTLGETGGEKTHTLTIAEMPSHTHTYSLPNNSDPNFMTGGGIYNVKTVNTTATNSGLSLALSFSYISCKVNADILPRKKTLPPIIVTGKQIGRASCRERV